MSTATMPAVCRGGQFGSTHTVRDCIKTILAKFGVHTQHAAVAAAIESGPVIAGKPHP